MDEKSYGEDAEPQVDDATKALVTKWVDRIKTSKTHWSDCFKQMRKNQDFAYYGAEKEWVTGGNYCVPILPRVINQSVSSLYAKNPTVEAKRKRRLQYQMWDGRADSLQSAMQMAAMGDPSAMALLQEVLAVRQQNLQIDRMGKTLEIVYDYFLDEQAVNFKQQLKAAVRRAKVCRASFIKIGFQRLLEPRPEVVAEIADVTSKLARVESLLHDAAEGELDTVDAEMAELKTLLADLQTEEFMIAREGLIFDFPKSDSIIIDKNVQHLKSLAGAGWAAQEFEGTPDKVEAIYGVDIGDKYTRFQPDGKIQDGRKGDDEQCFVHWYEVWDKQNDQWFTVCDGYPDFLKPPAPPDIKIERFWPIFPIVFNEVEHDEMKYPPSDVELGRDIQNEYNRSREALREHRIAARPFYVEGGQLGEAEKKRLGSHAAHEVITLPALATGQKIDELVQRGPTANIDPNLYEVEMHYNDLLRVVGVQEATLGGTSDSTATESSIAEESRTLSQSDNVDDLDEVLSELARAGGQILLTEMSKEKVVEIAGEGAVWPEMPETRDAVARDIFLDVKAGSSGRPNLAREIANTERAMPILLQLPGVNPAPLVKRYADLLDLDVDELFAEGVPSITALNAIVAKGPMAPPGAGPESDPNAQGPEGSQNAPGTQTNEPGPQPAYPAPAEASPGLMG